MEMEIKVVAQFSLDDASTMLTMPLSAIDGTFNVTLMYAVVWTINSHYAIDSSKPLTILNFATWETSRGRHNDLIDAVLRLASSANRIKFLLEGERVDAQQQVDAVQPPLAPANALNMQTTAIWLLDSVWAYYRLERRLLQTDGAFKRNGYYCIVYTGEEEERLDTIRMIFKRLFAIYVINVNVFIMDRSTASTTAQVHVYNYYPYRELRCQSSLPIHYASFMGGLGVPPRFLLPNRTLFFDDKLDNMHGCPLRIVTFQHRPFVIIEPPAADGQRQLLGIEGELIALLAERMNFAIELLEQPAKDRGSVYPNGSVSGAMGMIVEGSVNLTFGAFMYSKERAQFMLPSITYTSFPIVLCVPGGHQLSPLQRLSKPLGHLTWLCLWLSIALGCGLIVLLQLMPQRWRRFVLGSENTTPLLGLWCTLLGGMHPQPPRRNFARYLLVLWLLQTLVLRAAYTGELYILLQDGRMRTPLRTLAEVLDKNYVFHMLPALENVFRDLLPVMRIRIEPQLDATLRELRDNEEARIVAPLLKPTAARFDMDSGPMRPRLSVLPNPLLTAPLTLYMRPHSYLKQRINGLLMNMMSAGLVHRFRRMYLDRIEHLAVVRNRDPSQLSLWLLGAIFGLYINLQLCACFVFLLERRSAAPHRQRLRRFMDALNHFVA
ncbi:uncharacterized protein LOC133848340 [Drosophila sulfurigaster albostrigata]|uniref:uncharacterized protein LOC133848340 n=1 Tax=Drosophila sulfurigaster albostrigata TaxID=89887 RepID=UPI002D219239|nr:uncharacterized protein LOC133848340 [Drosophila sulfurigaster albostrigata]